MPSHHRQRRASARTRPATLAHDRAGNIKRKALQELPVPRDLERLLRRRARTVRPIPLDGQENTEAIEQARAHNRRNPSGTRPLMTRAPRGPSCFSLPESGHWLTLASSA